MNKTRAAQSGCSKGNPCQAGGEGNLRNNTGNMIMAFAEYYGICINNIAEANAILTGLSCTNDLIVDSSGDSMKVGKGGCGEERGDCKQGNGKGGAEEKLFENEDYIYTQSLP
ncbi:hypothetical protein RND71_025590 [Anisodus tanguticus]|uniref:Uncharacterized protein n=1 Tax=Anisodus tanguticus TaxID=243964 RepID=A0AAE1VCT2_9SOLA|nr:hypothetical protein RND71_025590 [Anisodus tanguticus]